MSGSNPKNHHYHPKLLLKDFCPDNSTQLFVYDLNKREIRNQNFESVGCEKNFYSILNNGELDKRLELAISGVETKAASALRKFKDLKSNSLSDKERENIAVFIALMGIRTPFFLNMTAKLKICSEEIDRYQEEKNPELTLPRSIEIGRDSLLAEPFLPRTHLWLAQNILKMNWSLVKAHPRKKFITSDNPLCSILKHSPCNQNGFNWFDQFQDSTLRLYLPLSKEYAWLGHFESSLKNLIEADEDWMEMFERNCVIWADKYIFTSIKEESIFDHALQYYGIKPFDIDDTNIPQGFIIPATIVKRAGR